MTHIGDYLFLYDIAAIALMLVLSYLSRRLGEALKIFPYYRVLYATSATVFAAFALDTLRFGAGLGGSRTLTMSLRCGAGLAALAVCLRYWSWLFSEFFKR